MADAYKIIKFSGPELPEAYRPMLQSRFLRSLRRGNDYFGLIDRESYFTVYRAYFISLLSRPESMVRLAVISDDVDIVLGWSLMEPKKLHYVHVNSMKTGDGDLRRQGIGRALVPEPFETFTHITKMGLLLWSSHFPEAKFDPFT